MNNEKKTTYTGERANAEERSLDVGKQGSLTDKGNSEYIFKKTEKISTAVYLITEFLSDTEPLKKSMRDRALAALITARPGSYVSIKDSTAALYELEDIITELISLLELSYRAGYISEMNFEIFHKELLHLIRSVRDGRAETANARYTFPKDFFSVREGASWKKRDEEMVTRYGKEFERIREEVLGSWRGGSEQGGRRPDPTRENGSWAPSSSTSRKSFSSDRPGRVLRSVGQEESASYIKDKEVERARGQESVRNTDRRNKILSLIREKGEAGIKDISKVVSGCSEKTIQRELAALVKEGVLQKTGERRWSRYSLKV